MTINLRVPASMELHPKITVFGVGGAGGNAVTNMIKSELEGVDFVVANTDAQALTGSKAERKIQMGSHITQGLGAGARPEVGTSGGRRVARRDRRKSRRRPYGVHHRRHGRRHRIGRSARHRQGRARSRHLDRRRRHQAVSIRGRAALAHRRDRRSKSCSAMSTR